MRVGVHGDGGTGTGFCRVCRGRKEEERVDEKGSFCAARQCPSFMRAL